MSNPQASYRQIMKATSLFGGVQFFQILISIIRSKLVAVLLGPTGMGIMGLLTSTVGLVSGLTNFGLGTSAVKNISEANASNDEGRISTVVSVMRRLMWITGLLGAMVTLALSPWLSQLTFGNREYTLAFVWLSITLLFNQLSTGEQVLLQGFRRLRNLAKANIYGSATGLIIAIPMYYKWGLRGIVPVIIITSVVSALFAWIYSRKIKTVKADITRSIVVSEGKNMLVMGFMISLSGLISIVVAYLIRIYINHAGDAADVGFYSAGFTIINTYVGMIFTAMATDYYPRLSIVATNNGQCRESINQQAEIALLILAPILIGFLVFVNWAIVLLYSSQFLAITGMMYWAALGIFFKAVSWAVAFIFLAKGASKLFFWNELAGNGYTLLFNVLGYHWGGLTGLGISFLVTYMMYLVQVYVIARLKYSFSFGSSCVKIFAIQFLLAIIGFAVVNMLTAPLSYLLGVVLIGVSGWFSYKELDRRIGLKDIAGDIVKKIRKK